MLDACCRVHTIIPRSSQGNPKINIELERSMNDFGAFVERREDIPKAFLRNIHGTGARRLLRDFSVIALGKGCGEEKTGRFP